MSHVIFHSNLLSFINESTDYTKIESKFLNISVDLRHIIRGEKIYKLEIALKSTNPIEKKSAISFCNSIGSRLGYIASCLRQIKIYEKNNKPIPMDRDNLRKIYRDFSGIDPEEAENSSEYYKDLALSYK